MSEFFRKPAEVGIPEGIFSRFEHDHILIRLPCVLIDFHLFDKT